MLAGWGTQRFIHWRVVGRGSGRRGVLGTRSTPIRSSWLGCGSLLGRLLLPLPVLYGVVPSAGVLLGLDSLIRLEPSLSETEDATG